MRISASTKSSGVHANVGVKLSMVELTAMTVAASSPFMGMKARANIALACSSVHMPAATLAPRCRRDVAAPLPGPAK
jgi:hypothetical protein